MKKLNFFACCFLVFFFILVNSNLSIGTEIEKKNATNTKNVTTIGYIPPNEAKEAQQVTVNATRGSCNSTTYQMRLLSPQDHTPQTIADHPTFLAYFPKKLDKPLIFTIVAPSVIEPLVERKIYNVLPGFLELTTEQEDPKLEVNSEYIITLMIACNERHPSENAYVRASFKKVAMKPEIYKQVTMAQDDLARSQILAAEGIWFDSLATIYEAIKQNPSNQDSSRFFWELLKEIDFSG